MLQNDLYWTCYFCHKCFAVVLSIVAVTLPAITNKQSKRGLASSGSHCYRSEVSMSHSTIGLGCASTHYVAIQSTNPYNVSV